MESQEHNFETTLLFFADHLPNNYLFAMTLSPPRWKLAAVENEMNNHSDHLVALETGSNEACTFPSWQENSPYTEYEFLPRRTGHFTEHSVTQESTDDQEDSESDCSENKTNVSITVETSPSRCIIEIAGTRQENWHHPETLSNTRRRLLCCPVFDD
ncbi:uncharacterized protein ASPGLDRAFT_1169278 [Aspergillus glaucus CBS 516.65]|uniref:Uncharacterized protein n=1 Tax=Aspergillus glaucus CBS 516.65 TaxID=1160497 RepID=A0A1L9VTY7_ASPGL|nr:hypothetical protein ASPGLDRAFT_1169278 [Aspergillus glaucus CBS 516.65]OJJ87393.1 hypothetical protein ASPGLDRAFT_1169278 [Aspergillus glaucus CBS 516.65]